MGKINVGRWILGGVIAGIVIFVLEGVASLFYLEDMQRAMAAHDLPMEMTAGAFVISVVVSLLVGFVLTFFYALGRVRLGPGPKAAAVVASMLWAGGYVPTLLGYHLLGLFPGRMLVTWGIAGLVEMILAGLAGAWVYREES